MTLFFMHLTKTAGGSLKELLRDAARGGDDILFYYADEPGFRPHFDYDRFPRVMFGHYTYGVHENAELPANYACFLREPVARTISHYHHLKNNDYSPIGKRLRNFESMEQYLKYSKHWEFDNFLTRSISGVINQVRHGDVGYNIYEKARYNLRCNFSYIGIFERMQESLKRLKPVIPKISQKLPSVNVGNYSKTTSAEELRLLRSLNRFDELLYEEALALFDKRS